MNWLGTIKSRLGMVLAPSVDHLGAYRARVVAQSADFRSVDIIPDDRRIAGEQGLSKVPILLGLPGCTVQFAAGCYVLLGWRGGDPRQPYVTTWESGATLSKLVVNGSIIYLGGETGAKLLVLNGDAVAVSAAMQTWMNNVAAGISAGGGGALAPLAGTTIGTASASATITLGK